MKKSLILLLFLMLDGMSHSYAGMMVYFQPMPMPTQYRNFKHYEQALLVWENVYTKMMARTANIQWPPMPKPTQYQNHQHYQQALEIWERVGSTPRISNSYSNDSDFVALPPMPMPTQYRKWERYQQALQSWINVSRNRVAGNHNILPPPMPMPTQYRKLEHYERALQAWEDIFLPLANE
jgi:hypothetical protein